MSSIFIYILGIFVSVVMFLFSCLFPILVFPLYSAFVERGGSELILYSIWLSCWRVRSIYLFIFLLIYLRVFCMSSYIDNCPSSECRQTEMLEVCLLYACWHFRASLFLSKTNIVLLKKQFPVFLHLVSPSLLSSWLFDVYCTREHKELQVCSVVWLALLSAYYYFIIKLINWWTHLHNWLSL